VIVVLGGDERICSKVKRGAPSPVPNYDKKEPETHNIIGRQHRSLKYLDKFSNFIRRGFRLKSIESRCSPLSFWELQLFIPKNQLERLLLYCFG
jgi:hypothetical protein